MDIQNEITKRTFKIIGFSLFVMVSSVIAVQNLMAMVILKVAPGFQDSIWYIWVLTGISFYCVGFPLFLRMMKELPDGPKGQKKEMSLKELMVMFCIAMAAAYLFNVIGNFINLAIGLLKGAPVVNPLLEVIGTASMFSTAIFAGILSPIIEEIVFRGVLLDKLRGYGDQTAIIFTALTFGLFHGNLSQFFYATVLGLFFGFIAIKTNTIKYTIILHIVINMLGAVIMPALVLAENQMLMSLAGLFIVVIFVVGIRLYIKSMKEVRLEPGKLKIDPKNKIRTIYFNLGMILFYLVCSYLFINVILA